MLVVIKFIPLVSIFELHSLLYHLRRHDEVVARQVSGDVVISGVYFTIDVLDYIL